MPQAPTIPYPTIHDLMLVHLQHADCGASTLSLKRRRLMEFAGYLAGKSFADCRAFDLVAWLKAQADWGDWTKHGACLIVQACFNWCVKMGLIAANPFAGVTHPPGGERRDLTVEELEALIAASSMRFGRVLLFLWFTGMRPCELRRLQWRHLDLSSEPALAVFPAGEHKTGRKTREPRPVPLIPEALRILAAQEAETASEFCFVSQRGGPYKAAALERAMRRARDKAGLTGDVTLYCCRHAMGTRLAEAGFGSPIISAVLGHKKSATSDRYSLAHLRGKHAALAEAIRRVTPQRFLFSNFPR